MPRLVVGSDRVPERIDKLLPKLVPGTSRATVQRWIAEGRVKIDGAPCKVRDVARPGSTIEFEPGPEPRSELQPEPDVPFAVLFEDAHLVVVEKPAGVVVHPARGHRTGTLIAGLLAREGFALPPSDPRDPQGALRPGLVQRLDKDTSGVLVVAKDPPSRDALKAQLAARRMERRYLALTQGVPRAGRLESLHGRDSRSRVRFTTKVQRGRSAITNLEVVERLAGGRAALVACRLETGRTHQIRVHLLELAKTPILGDPLYGATPRDPEIASIAEELGRQALHAAMLGFVHPVTGAELRFEAPLPADMQRALERLRALNHA